ncbi:MAG: AraC family transcriptional regulator [Betaproteobacteria bacterium]
MNSPRKERAIRTFSLTERLASSDFGIRDETSFSRVGEAHRHEYLQVQLNLTGRTEQHIGSTVRPLVPGTLSFVLPYRVHRIRHPPGSRFYVVSFNLRFLRPELNVDPLDLEDLPLAQAPELAPFLFQEFMDYTIKGPDLATVRDACRRMAHEYRRRRFCSAEIIRANLMLLLATVCRCFEPAILRLAAGQAQRKRRRDVLARAMRNVRENLAARISLQGVAAAAHLSPNYLAHLVKKETGKTFIELLTERRMEKARELLLHTTLRISEIAHAAGFEDGAYFARRFKQIFGVTPSLYRVKAGGTSHRKP